MFFAILFGSWAAWSAPQTDAADVAAASAPQEVGSYGALSTAPTRTWVALY